MPTGGVWKDRKVIQLYNLILPHKEGFEIDHINGVGLDNRKENLRYATRQQNQRNQRPQKNRSSKYKGVSTLSKRSGYIKSI